MTLERQKLGIKVLKESLVLQELADGDAGLFGKIESISYKTPCN